MNTLSIRTLNFYFNELYTAHKLDDFDNVAHYHTKISTYSVAMIDFGIEFEICDALCSEANRVMMSMF